MSARVGRHGLSIEVADNAGGLPPAALASLFQPFSGSSKPEGSGLGLAISRELVRAQGGDISLLETSPEGTTFRVMLPERCLAVARLEKV